ncbi:MAG: glutamate--tRNA ligase [Pseudomonadales bacterium]
MSVRTRIAPSPTGDPHVGTAYIALFNLCFAKQHGGRFILRIEDTDAVRSTAASEQAIFDSLRWLGLDWDEGPDVGGEYGPYRQSERSEIYAGYATQLVEQGNAFYCFATSEELDEMRREQMAAGLPVKYDGRGLALADDEVQRRLAAGDEHVIRMKIPEQGSCRVQDMLRGNIEIEWQQVDMQVLLKADGLPTYHLANVVDDHLMEITHVIRGEEWINSAPKHQLLYEYFGWNMPTLCHLPLLRNPDKSKLSKRKNPTSIQYYERMGYLPEALTNYLGRMGWSMPDEREKFSLAEMQAEFDLARVSLGGPIFDVEKLDWLNGQWIRDDLTEDDLLQRLKEWAFNEPRLKAALPLIQPRIEKLSDVAPAIGHLYSGLLDLSEQDFEALKLEQADQIKVLQFALWSLEQQSDWSRDALFDTLKTLAQAMDIKLQLFLSPLFVAISGSTSTFSVMDALALLGPDISRARTRHAINVLGGVSKKQNKKFEKEFAGLTN